MRRLLLPSVIILFFFVLSAVQTDLAAAEERWLLPSRAALAVVLLLAWRLRRGRIAWAAVALAAAAEGFAMEIPESADLRLGIALLLPLSLGVVACLPEWWVTSKPGLLRWAALTAIAASAYGMTLPMADVVVAGISSWGAGRSGVPVDDGVWRALTSSVDGWATGIDTPPAVLLALCVGAGLGMLALWKKRTPVEAGLLGTVAASALAYGRPEELRFYATASALILGAALVENAFALAFHDSLTGLPARRALEERLAQVGRSYALAMLDLDHFKQFNDKHGHEVGDQILRLVASRMSKVTGGGEAFRYGGEEFTIVFAGRTAAETKAHMDALREDIAGRKFTVRSPGRPRKKPKGALPKRAPIVTKALKVTVSIGVAERSAKYPNPEDVMKAADKALYQSKKNGRNRVTVAK